MSPAQLLPKTELMDEDMMDAMSDDEITPMKKAGAIASATSSSASRPRALISDEQVATLKAYYSINAKPRREELLRISEEIGHTFKVKNIEESYLAMLSFFKLSSLA